VLQDLWHAKNRVKKWLKQYHPDFNAAVRSLSSIFRRMQHGQCIVFASCWLCDPPVASISGEYETKLRFAKALHAWRDEYIELGKWFRLSPVEQLKEAARKVAREENDDTPENWVLLPSEAEEKKEVSLPPREMVLPRAGLGKTFLKKNGDPAKPHNVPAYTKLLYASMREHQKASRVQAGSLSRNKATLKLLKINYRRKEVSAGVVKFLRERNGVKMPKKRVMAVKMLAWGGVLRAQGVPAIERLLVDPVIDGLMNHHKWQKPSNHPKW
jgi:hypothetical protein